MRTYRLYGFNRDGAERLAAALAEDGMSATVQRPGDHDLPGWGVTIEGEPVSEGLLEDLAHFFGGAYEGEGLAGA